MILETTLGHYDCSTIFRSLLSPDFFDSLLLTWKSGDKGERYASPDWFCTLRYVWIFRFILYEQKNPRSLRQDQGWRLAYGDLHIFSIPAVHAHRIARNAVLSSKEHRFVRPGQVTWLTGLLVLIYSGGTVPDSHRLPYFTHCAVHRLPKLDELFAQGTRGRW